MSIDTSSLSSIIFLQVGHFAWLLLLAAPTREHMMERACTAVVPLSSLFASGRCYIEVQVEILHLCCQICASHHHLRQICLHDEEIVKLFVVHTCNKQHM